MWTLTLTSACVCLRQPFYRHAIRNVRDLMSSSPGWLSRLRTRLSGGAGDDSPLMEFAPEEHDPPGHPAVERPRAARSRLWYAGVAIVAIGAVGAMGMSRWQGVSASAASLTIHTQPAGASVTIDGADRGATPLTLQIAPGSHRVTIRSGEQQRSFDIDAAPGADIVRDLEFAAAAPLTGTVAVVTEPEGAAVTIDGTPAGAAPVSIDLPAGTHRISVSSAAGTSEREITLAVGQNASVVFSLAPRALPANGWVQISAPFDVQLVENGEVIGNGATRVMLRTGSHDLILLNGALGYEEDRRVTVGPGQTISVRVDPPLVALNINARPWAEVTLDGVALGQTPIANAMVPIGARRLVFRHPDLGERQHNVIVTSKPGQRVAIDLTK